MMDHLRYRRTPALCLTLAAITVVCALPSRRVAAQTIITEIIDPAGDGGERPISLWGSVNVAAC